MKQPKQILMLPSVYLPNGGEYVNEQAQLVARRGYDVHILANLFIPLSFNGRSYFTLPFKRSICYIDHKIPVTAYYYRRIPKLFKPNIEGWIARSLRLYEAYVEEHGHPDLIHVHSVAWAGCVAYEIKQRYGVPYIITEHLSFDVAAHEVAMDEAYGRNLLCRAYNQCEELITVTQKLYNEGVAQGWIARETPHRVVSNVTEDSFFQVRRFPHNSPFTFACINDFWHPKGYDVLLKVVDILGDEGVDFSIKIAGSRFGSPAFQEMLRSCRHADKLDFVGRLSRPEVVALLSQADAMVLPSRAEAQSRAVLEALAVGVPVVTTDIICEEMVNTHTGIRVRNEDAADLAKGMHTMMGLAHRYDPQALTDYSRALSNSEVVAEKITAVYAKVLSPL